MEKKVAESLLSLAVSMDHTIGSMFAEIRKISDEEVRAKFDKAVGDLMGHVAKELISPIFDRFPDLDPDKNTEV